MSLKNASFQNGENQSSSDPCIGFKSNSNAVCLQSQYFPLFVSKYLFHTYHRSDFFHSIKFSAFASLSEMKNRSKFTSFLVFKKSLLKKNVCFSLFKKFGLISEV